MRNAKKIKEQVKKIKEYIFKHQRKFCARCEWILIRFKILGCQGRYIFFRFHAAFLETLTIVYVGTPSPRRGLAPPEPTGNPGSAPKKYISNINNFRFFVIDVNGP